MPDERTRSLINCHAHIFTGKHVPPYLARSFVPWPLYYIVSVPVILWIFRLWRDIGWLKYKGWYRKLDRILYPVRRLFSKYWVGAFLKTVVGVFLVIQAFFILYDWLSAVFAVDSEDALTGWIEVARTWLQQNLIVFQLRALVIDIIIVGIVLFLIPMGRNLILWILTRFWKFLGVFQGDMTRGLIDRYRLLGLYTLYRNQAGIFSRLKQQYPPGTQFVLLPMDMDYMGAGKVKHDSNLRKQLDDLVELKNDNGDTVHPFLCVDPRRIRESKVFFDYDVVDGDFSIKDCMVREYIETHGFAGFKLYPPLGYYPFDEALLPVWKYAADNNIPIMTHCVRGPMFYRGRKKEEWNHHPVFKEPVGDGVYAPLVLPQKKNKHFTTNFTHPLNYLCLLDETLLRQLVSKAKDDRVRQIFGFNGIENPMSENLTNLKVCLAHYGGDEEWERFLEKDRYPMSNHVITQPLGLDFLHKTDKPDELSPGKPEQIWKFVDWYSIITSLMLRYPNVYADISYILHNTDIYPLLKRTIAAENEKLSKRVLFGTDFYVVRNHKSDKNLLTDLFGGLDDEEIDRIARDNPREYLQRSVA